jgi:plasmid replication initiation protein
MKKELIVKHNDFIEAKYNLTLTELKIIAKLSSMIQKDDDDFKSYKFTAKELLDDLKLNNNYDDLRDSIKKLLTRLIIIKTEKSVLATTFLSSAEYFKDSTVELSFDKKLKPYLLQLKNNFTMYQFENVVALSSFYAIRIYELCKQYETIKERTIEIKELKEILDIKVKSYNIYNNFKQKVLEIAEREINEKTDIHISFEEIKTSRKVTSIKFIIKSKIKEVNKKNIEKEILKKIEEQKKKVNENTYIEKEEKIDFESLTEKEKEFLEKAQLIAKG